MQQESVWPYWQSETDNGTILSEETSGLRMEKCTTQTRITRTALMLHSD